MSNSKIDLKKIKKQIKRLPIIVYILILLLGILILLLSKNHNDSHDDWSFWMNIGSDFISVTLIFFLLKIFSASEELDGITEILDEHISECMSKVSIEIPDRSYGPSQYPQKQFNIDMTNDLCNSYIFFFQGTSAKFVPVRLLGTHNNLSIVKIVMLNPSNKEVILIRARDRKRNPYNKNKSLEEIVEDIRSEIYLSIIGLFQCRAICCPIHILYDNSGTSVSRLEVFEQHSYISFYQSEDSFENTHPQALRYAKGSLIHNMHKLQFDRLSGVLGNNTFSIESNTDENSLIQHLGMIGFVNNIKSIRDGQKKFEEFYKQNYKLINIKDH